MKSRKTRMFVALGLLAISGFSLMVVLADETKTIKLDVNNAIQTIPQIIFRQSLKDNNSAILRNVDGKSLIQIVTNTNSFVLSKGSDSSATGSGSTILGGNSNHIEGTNPNYSTIIGGDNNQISSASYGTIGGGSNGSVAANYGVVAGGDNNVAGSTHSTVVGGKGNRANGQSSVALGTNNVVRGKESVVMGSGATVSGNNTFLWNDGTSANTVNSNDTFAVIGEKGMVVNTEQGHRFAQLTIGGSLLVNESTFNTGVVCNGSTQGVLKVMNREDVPGQVCFCNCDGTKWNSLFGAGKCSSVCDNKTVQPACGGNGIKNCDGSKITYSGTCLTGTLVEGTGAFMIGNNGNLYWTCQTTDGTQVQCNGPIASNSCPNPEGTYVCTGNPENAEFLGGNSGLADNLGPKLYSTQALAQQALNRGEKCVWYCKDGFYLEGEFCLPRRACTERVMDGYEIVGLADYATGEFTKIGAAVDYGTRTCKRTARCDNGTISWVTGESCSVECNAGFTWNGTKCIQNGVCATEHYNCTAGTSTNNNYNSSTHKWTWKCAGINGGTTASCSQNDIINGQCGGTHYTCAQGTSANNTNGSTAYTWTCKGINGGTDASCNEDKVIEPVCGSTHYNCTAGVSSNNTTSDTQYLWQCQGINGGGTINCSEGRVRPGECGGTHYNCTVGTSTSNNYNSSTNVYTWTCQGINGGANASCSESDVINGQCAGTVDRCTKGTYQDETDTATEYKWTCKGINGGTNASCSKAKEGTIGQCGSTHYNCIAGTSINNTDDDAQYKWVCQGSNGGSDAYCTENKPAVNGECGREENTCSKGILDIDSEFCDSYGEICYWTCLGINGGINASCSYEEPLERVDGECGSNVDNCKAGTYQDVTDTATYYLRNCLGRNGGSDDSCSKAKPVVINGDCGTALNQCVSGDYGDVSDSATHHRWRCVGQNGGTTDNCTLPKDPKCGGSHYNCTLGTSLNNNYDSSANKYTWICENDGKTANCSETIGCSAVNGQCSSSHYGCTKGTSTNNNYDSSLHKWTWTCEGTCGGSNDSCSETECTAVNGQCGGTVNGCTKGTSTNNNYNPTTHVYTWSCEGSCGGTTASCSKNEDIDGACGSSVNTCEAGTYQDVTDTTTEYKWNCVGINAGSTANCSKDKPTPINGACGSSVDTCTAGNYQDVTDTTAEYKWNCVGTNGGTTDNCIICKSGYGWNGSSCLLRPVCGYPTNMLQPSQGELCSQGTPSGLNESNWEGMREFPIWERTCSTSLGSEDCWGYIPTMMATLSDYGGDGGIPFLDVGGIPDVNAWIRGTYTCPENPFTTLTYDAYVNSSDSVHLIVTCNGLVGDVSGRISWEIMSVDKEKGGYRIIF